MQKSFNKLFNIYRIRLAYLITVGCIFVTLFFISASIKAFLDEETYLLSFWGFFAFWPIFVVSYLIIFIMHTSCTITVGLYICETKEEKKNIKEYAFLGILVPSFLLLLILLLFYFLPFSTTSESWIVIVIMSSLGIVISTINLYASYIKKKVDMINKKGLIKGDYVIPFEFISKMEFIFDPDKSTRGILKIYINEKKYIKIYVNAIYANIKEVYPNIRLFNKKENKYLD